MFGSARDGQISGRRHPAPALGPRGGSGGFPPPPSPGCPRLPWPAFPGGLGGACVPPGRLGGRVGGGVGFRWPSPPGVSPLTIVAPYICWLPPFGRATARHRTLVRWQAFFPSLGVLGGTRVHACSEAVLVLARQRGLHARVYRVVAVEGRFPSPEEQFRCMAVSFQNNLSTISHNGQRLAVYFMRKS